MSEYHLSPGMIFRFYIKVCIHKKFTYDSSLLRTSITNRYVISHGAWLLINLRVFFCLPTTNCLVKSFECKKCTGYFILKMFPIYFFFQCSSNSQSYYFIRSRHSKTSPLYNSCQIIQWNVWSFILLPSFVWPTLSFRVVNVFLSTCFAKQSCFCCY